MGGEGPLIDLVVAAAAGALAGSIAGLIPGVHPNTLAVLALTALPAAGTADVAMPFAAALAAMGLANQFTAIVPASFLGAPSADDALRTLPAQELLREGRASEALALAIAGSAAGVAFALLLILPLRLLLGPRGETLAWLAPGVPVILFGVAAILLLTERAELPWRRALRAEAFPEPGQHFLQGRLLRRHHDALEVDTVFGRRWIHDPLLLLANAEPGDTVETVGRNVRIPGPGSRILGIAAAALVFLLAALLGSAVRSLATPSPFGLPASPMFPLLTGLFGTPSLLLALRSGPIPEQRDRPAIEPRDRVAAAGAAGALCGALVGLLPGMSGSAASVLALVVRPQRAREGVLVTLSAAGAGAAVVTAAAYILAQHARSGTMLAVAEVAPPEPWTGWLPPRLLVVLLLGCLAGAALGAVVAIAAGRAAVRVIHRIPYARVSAFVLALILALVGAFTGLLGLALLATATCLGLLPWLWGLRKGHLMGCTMGPLMASLWM